MKCPTCGHGEHRVMRTDADDGVLRRARECLRCGKRWHTIEAPETVYKQVEAVRELGRKLRDAIGE
jgi:transcriptional regulator NrdR family protein